MKCVMATLRNTNLGAGQLLELLAALAGESPRRAAPSCASPVYRISPICLPTSANMQVVFNY